MRKSGRVVGSWELIKKQKDHTSKPVFTIGEKEITTQGGGRKGGLRTETTIKKENDLGIRGKRVSALGKLRSDFFSPSGGYVSERRKIRIEKVGEIILKVRSTPSYLRKV